MTAVLLPIPDDPRFQAMVDLWNNGQRPSYFHPRSVWLWQYEGFLREFYPQASPEDLSLTARSVAPFPLAAGKDVP